MKRYDILAPGYDIAHFVQTFGHDRIWRRRVCEHLSLSDGHIIIDVCTGTGLNLAALLRRGADQRLSITGIDVSSGMIRIAQARLRRIGAGSRAHLCRADVEKLPLLACSVDFVVSTCGLGGVPNVKKALQEALRALKPEGKLVALEMCQPPSGVIFRLIHRVLISRVIRLIWGFRDTPLPELVTSSRWLDGAGESWQWQLESCTYYRDALFGSVVLVVASKVRHLQGLRSRFPQSAASGESRCQEHS